MPKLVKGLRNAIKEVIETISLLLSPEALRGLREAEEDIRRGRVRSWDEFLRELGKRTPQACPRASPS